MRRVAQVLGKTAVCAVARAAPAPLAPASRAAMAVAPVRLSPASLCTAGQPPSMGSIPGARVRAGTARASALTRARRFFSRRARVRRGVRATEATPLDATRLEPRFLPGENTANGPLS